jgi:hypothetical protein
MVVEVVGPNVDVDGPTVVETLALLLRLLLRLLEPPLSVPGPSRTAVPPQVALHATRSTAPIPQMKRVILPSYHLELSLMTADRQC